jgi:hypothetical protein
MGEEKRAMAAGWRRQPVVFVLDRSGSIRGSELEAAGPALVADLLRFLAAAGDPQVPVLAAVVAFQSEAFVLCPLRPLDRVRPEALRLAEIEPSGASDAGGALAAVAQMLEKNLVKAGGQCKGDGDPLIFFFTDGEVGGLEASRLGFLERGTTVLCGRGDSFEAFENTLHKVVRGRVLSSYPDQRKEMEDVIVETLAALKNDQEMILRPTDD